MPQLHETLPNHVSTPTSGSQLAREAHQRLENYNYIGLRQLSCEEKDVGLICVQGTVSSYYHKQLAQEIVRRVEGVVVVDNQLKVSELATRNPDTPRKPK